jgi:heat shock protein HtpX
MLKTTALMAAMAILLVFIGGALGGRTGMTFALIMAFGLNFFTYWYSDRVVLRMYKAREVTEAQAPELFGMVRTLASRAQVPMPRVYVIDQPQPNAFATGRNPKHAAVAVTTGVMRLLTRDELMGVLGHELSHIRNRDILIGTIAATFAAAISYLSYMAQWAMIFGGGDDDDGGNPFAAIVMMIVGPIAAMLIQLAISRSREYGADRGGAEVAGNPLYLAGALRKLQQASKEIPMQASPATSHMFIVNPLRGGKMAKLFSTHPPMAERVARLEAMAAGRSL